MAELKVLNHECGYEQNMQEILLKDQFIFGVTVREIQEHLNDIEDEHDLNHCLQEARKIESHMAQHKLLVLNQCSMTPLAKETVVGLRKNQNLKTNLSPDPNPVEVLKTASIVVQTILIGSVQLMAKIVRHVVERTILPRSVDLGKAKAKALVMLSTNHLNTERSTWTKSQVMTMVK